MVDARRHFRSRIAHDCPDRLARIHSQCLYATDDAVVSAPVICANVLPALSSPSSTTTVLSASSVGSASCTGVGMISIEATPIS